MFTWNVTKIIARNNNKSLYTFTWQRSKCIPEIKSYHNIILKFSSYDEFIGSLSIVPSFNSIHGINTVEVKIRKKQHIYETKKLIMTVLKHKIHVALRRSIAL